MVYDIIPLVPTAIGTVEVNASIYTADCLAVAPDDLPSISGNASPYEHAPGKDTYSIAPAGYYGASMEAPCA